MPVFSSDIVPGAVAFLYSRILNEDPCVVKPQSPAVGHRPFLHLGTRSGLSTWVELTTQQFAAGVKRFQILPEWRVGGDGMWHKPLTFINETFYAGPGESFLDASKGADPYRRPNRPRLTHKGFEAVLRYLAETGQFRPSRPLTELAAV